MNAMLHRRTVLLSLLGAAAPLSRAQAPAQRTAEELLAAANAWVHFADSTMLMTMQVARDGRVESEYEMKVHKLDTQRMRIEFTQPTREKGRKLLRVGDKMWMYLPDLGKPIVISARQSFLGSSFANGDLMRTDLVADYVPTLLREEAVDGVAAQVLQLQARSPEVAYDRIVLWIDKASQRPLRQEMYTLSGKRLKTLHYGDPTRFNGVPLNATMRVESVLTPHESTVLKVSDLAVHQKLAAVLFQKEGFER